MCGLGNARFRLHAPLPPPRLSSFHLPRQPAPLNELCAFSKSFITSLPNLALRQRWRLMLQHPSMPNVGLLLPSCCHQPIPLGASAMPILQPVSHHDHDPARSCIVGANLDAGNRERLQRLLRLSP